MKRIPAILQSLAGKPVQLWMRASLTNVMLVALAGILAIGWLDSRSPDYSIPILYLLPILSVTLRAGFIRGFLICLAASLMYYLSHGRSSVAGEPGITLWNTLVQLGYFTLMSAVVRSHQLASETARHEREMSTKDPLTGLANRRALQTWAEREIARSGQSGQPLSVALLDADDFKAINDHRGHSVGDTFLRRLAHVLRSHLREQDFVARLGGDEFVIFMPDTDQTTARLTMDRLIPKLAGVGEHPLGGPVTFSAGVVTFLSPVQRPEDILRWVDGVMYSVKHGGKHAVSYAVWPSSDMDASI